MPLTACVPQRRWALLVLLMLSSARVRGAGIDDWIRQIAASDFSFTRAQTNVPFAPLPGSRPITSA